MRGGDWIQTYTGNAFWPIDPYVEDVLIEDIAHSLAMQCRFAGHCLRFYSVAEHCVLLAGAVSPENALHALLHDASEAYLCDVPRPLKPFLPGYKEAERRVEYAIGKRFGLNPKMPAEVKEFDGRILADEMRQNMAAPPMEWSSMREPLGVTLQYWSPEEAKVQFLQSFRVLSSIPEAS